jgi:hypothetical protein
MRSHVVGCLSIDVSVEYAASIFSILKINSAGTCVHTSQTVLRHLSQDHNIELILDLGSVN